MSAWLYLLQQGISSWSLLASLGALLGLRRPRPLRLTLTALACSLVCLAAAVHPYRTVRLLSLAAFSLLAPSAAWPGLPAGRRLHLAGCSLSLALIMAGCGRLLDSTGVPPALLAFLLPFLPLLLVRLAPRNRHTSCVTLEIVHGGHQLRCTALVDSGNLLHDPITRLPVIVISRQAAGKFLPGTEELRPGMRLISVRTVAGSALMPVFRPRALRLMTARGWRNIRAVIGLSPDGYSGYQALVPASVLSSAEEGGTSPCPSHSGSMPLPGSGSPSC